jgi:hypothetical protein
VCIHRGECSYVYECLCTYCVSKKYFYYYSCLLFQISANLPFNIDPTGSCNLKLNFYIRVML